VYTVRRKEKKNEEKEKKRRREKENTPGIGELIDHRDAV